MERTTLFVDVIVPLAVPQKYTYRVPVELNDEVDLGKRVLVQFGKSKFYSAIVSKVHDKAPTEYVAKYIDSVIDDKPIVLEKQLTFWDWMAYYYMCGPGEVMNAALPSALKLSSVANIQLNPDFNFEESDHSLFSEKEHLIIDALHHNDTLSFEDVSKILKIKSIHKTVNDLIKKGAILVYEEVKDKYKPKLLSFVKLNTEYKNETKLKELLDKLETKAFKQAEALLLFLHLAKTNKRDPDKGPSDRQDDSASSNGDNWVPKGEITKKCDAAAINALVKKGIFTEEKFEIGRLQFTNSETHKKNLTKEQKAAYTEIKTAFEKHSVSLLHGVTGSGKTEIYAKLIEETIANGQQVLFLLPEIALTTQLITRMRTYFGDKVGVYHSKFSENERVEIWNNVLNNTGENTYSIVMGARSALFLPYANLGLIIIDEEHDYSYKQHDPAPRYHARDAAIYLSTLHNCKVLLGSATPSLETYNNAATGKYGLIELNKRFTDGAANETVICDIKQSVASTSSATEDPGAQEHPVSEQHNPVPELVEGTYVKNKSILTHPLHEAIKTALKNKEQIILFQNRRGFAPYTECSSCGWIPHCTQCDVSLIYHKHSNKLTCHYCGYTIPPPSACAACGHNDLRYKGMGTEKIEEEIEILFPDAKIARMDLDTTRSKYAYKQIIDDFEEQNIDILIGTQMVTKGLDFDHVSVVGILNADSLFSFPDFRSHERGYQLITQVSGRAGRKHKQGKVFIQTLQPTHPVIQYVINDDLKLFYNNQLQERKQYHYPPYSRLIQLSVVAKDVNLVNNMSEELAKRLRGTFAKDLLGPQFPLVSKIKNNYYKRIILKIDKSLGPQNVRHILTSEINNLHQNYRDENFRVQIDVDPY
ncbi:MAG: primosomal protein N' [Bacteroidia bacterium]|nr:primosomal protein N' [Bacteroidia bacterium]